MLEASKFLKDYFFFNFNSNSSVCDALDFVIAFHILYFVLYEFENQYSNNFIAIVLFQTSFQLNDSYFEPKPNLGI